MVTDSSQCSGKFFREDIDEVGRPLAELIKSITQLRHTAEHRSSGSATRLIVFSIDAESLVRRVQGEPHEQQLSRLCRETRLVIKDVKRNKDLPGSQSVATMQRIATR